MGLTILQKSSGTRRKKKSRIALVLAGGAISGGAFKLGGLLALNTYLDNRKIIDLDIYVGVSAGAFLAAPLSAGIPPEELIRSIHGHSSIISQFKPTHFYYPNFAEFISKPLELARDTITFVPEMTRAFAHWLRQREGRQRLAHFMSKPSYAHLEELLAEPIREVMGQSKVRAGAISYVPSGLFDNKLIERFIRKNLRRNRLPNNFRLLHLLRGNSLYISATNLNTAKAVMFGHDEDNTVTISEAVQASSAIPGFYRPAKIGGVEYVDGGVRRTANLSRAVEKGADLIIAYNPFRPFMNVLDERPGSGYRSLGEMGPGMVLDQVFRTLLASRLKLGVEKLALDPKFTGDLLLIEPTETDARMFNISPIAFWKRAEAAEAGYLSCKATLEQHHYRLTKLFARYGVKTNLQRLLDDESALRAASRHDGEIFDVLTHDDASPTKRRLYVVK